MCLTGHLRSLSNGSKEKIAKSVINAVMYKWTATNNTVLSYARLRAKALKGYPKLLVGRKKFRRASEALSNGNKGKEIVKSIFSAT